MGDISKNCYSCGKICVNGGFCSDGGSLDSSQVSIPRNLKIKVIANPAYWGFSGGYDDNVLVSGWAVYSNGYFDFFDGFDPDHYGVKQCGQTLVGSFRNEQRPDIGYRSVYDDETGRSHYNGNISNDVMRGGAEVYLIDRQTTETSDQSSCDETDPIHVFKKNPDNFGYGNKILTREEIYKNITGGWRLSSCNSCYASGVTNELRFVCCSGSGGNNSPKQHILFDDNFGQYYDPAQKRCLSSHYNSEQACQPDGTTPKEYQGQLISVARMTGVSPYLLATVSYFDAPASGLRNGQQVLILDSGDQFYNAYHIFDLSHASTTTSFRLLGSAGNEDLTYIGGSGDKWIALGTIDPESCCGGAAFGVDNRTKQRTNQPVYHVDIPKIFNNSKNRIYSNRGKYQNGDPRIARNYVGASGSGVTALPQMMSGGYPYNPRTLPYFGPYYEVDNQDKALRFFNDDNTINHKNLTCYTKSQTLSVFPDCLTQSIQYDSCDQGSRHYQNNVPRLAFVYRPCNYNDPCSFNDSGAPYTAGGQGMPSTLDDLKRGFGGQEIVMYLNLGDAWGNEIRRTPCSCDNEPPGTIPPELVTISSPVTYPCFMKFDLRPSEYGCLDPSWYVYAKTLLGIPESGTCDIYAPIDACWVKQPYTTYGFIRNLCGHQAHDRKDVILSLADKSHAGTFTDKNQLAGSGITEPMYVSFTVPNDTLGSGYPVANGGTGNRPYWGLTDSEGRLAYPYFHTKINSGLVPCSLPPTYSQYTDFDAVKTMSGGFPTDSVPFLIEIDHEDFCVGCSTSNLEVKDHTITIESLPTKFYHGLGQITGYETYNDLIYKYGFNHCKYPGIAVTPTYDANSDSWKLGVCDTSTFSTQEDALVNIAAPYTAETCGCIGDGISTKLYTHPLEGTDIPKYWSTSGIQNSYIHFKSAVGDSGCDYGFLYNGEDADIADVLADYSIYFAVKMSCASTDYSSADASFVGDVVGNGLQDWLGCGGCSHSFPATVSKPNATMDFYYVRNKYRNLFERMSDLQLVKNKDFLNHGASRGSFYGGNRNVAIEQPNCSLGGGQSGISLSNGMGGTTCWPLLNNTPVPYGRGEPLCGQTTLSEDAVTYNGSTVGDCSYFLLNDLGYLKWDNNIPGCAGASIKIYGLRLTKQNNKDSNQFADIIYGHAGCGMNASGCNDPCIENEATASFNLSSYGPSYQFANNANGVASGTFCGFSPCPTSCSDIRDEIACLGACAGLEASIGCLYDKTSSCCHPTDIRPDTGQRIERSGEKFHSNCWADAAEYDLLGEFTYFDFSNADRAVYGNGCVDGWYGWLNFNHVHVAIDDTWTNASHNRLNSNIATPHCMLAWQGFNLPSIGDTEILPFLDPIAYNYTDISALFNNTASPSFRSICAYDQSVNKSIYVDSEFIIPSRTSDWGAEVHLAPINCENAGGVGSTCVKPIPFNTFTSASQISGYGPVETDDSQKVEVIKQSCFPEIMTVHKVECNNGIYALHVSREYYEHDRTLYYVDAYVDENTRMIVATKERLYGRLDGGRTVDKFECGTGKNQVKTADVCGASGVGCTVADTMPYYSLLPKMSETDGVTPCHPSVCVTGINPFSQSLCANYEHGTGEVTTGNGSGGRGYFRVLPAFSGSPTGCLEFFITNPGSGYYSPLYSSGNATIVVTGCAKAIFDFPPCVTLNLSVYPNTSYDKKFDVATQRLVDNSSPATSAQYFVYSGHVIVTNCGGYSSCGFNTGIYEVSFEPCNQTTVTLPCEPSTNICNDNSAYYPNLYNSGAGTLLWNFYNLFYDSGYLGGLCLDDADPDSNVWFQDTRPGDTPEPFPFNIQYNGNPKSGRLQYSSKNTTQIPLAEIIPFASTGLKCLHSCIQDHTTCGGQFFCNKEFFPRRSYYSGTKVSKFAPFSLCVQNGQPGWGNWLRGHVSDDFIDTYANSVLGENIDNGFLDPCKPESTLELYQDVGIDDHIIYVSGDINVLLSAKHPYYRMSEPNGLDTKSCLQPDSGCIGLPQHNSRTITGLEGQDFETGDTDVYSEIKQTGCLLEPFKIFVDVQCCQERLGHPGTEDPMYLSWITQGVPAGACKGIVFDASCTCSNENSCSINANAFGITPYTLSLLNYWIASEVSNTGCSSCPDNGLVVFEQPDFSDCCSYVSGVAMATNYDGQLYVFVSEDAGYPYGLVDRRAGVIDNYLHCTTTYPSRVVGWDFCNMTGYARLLGDTSTKLPMDSPLSKVALGSGIKNFGASGCIGGCNSYCAALMAEFGCKCVESASECQYPSILKVSVTE